MTSYIIHIRLKEIWFIALNVGECVNRSTVKGKFIIIL